MDNKINYINDKLNIDYNLLNDLLFDIYEIKSSSSEELLNLIILIKKEYNKNYNILKKNVNKKYLDKSFDYYIKNTNLNDLSNHIINLNNSFVNFINSIIDYFKLKEFDYKKKILIFEASPSDQDEIYTKYEVSKLENIINNSDYYPIIRIAISPKMLNRVCKLYDYDIMHLACHSSINQLILTNKQGISEPLLKTSLINTIKLNNKIELIYFNTCYSGLYAQDFINNNVLYCIGYNIENKTKSALDFSIDFYTNLVDCKNIEESFNKCINKKFDNKEEQLIYNEYIQEIVLLSRKK